MTPTNPLQLTEQFGRVHYGADYNPDQWPREVWDTDITLMRAAGLTVVSLPIFSWVHLQPDEDTWDFEWLDDILGRLHAGGIGFYLATATASVPAWVDQRYPSVLRTGQDGRRVRHGERHTFCPSSPDFARLSTGLVRRLAERYRDHPGLRLWHIGNEYGQICWCELCADRFRDWLHERYGSLDMLNARWNTAFWGHTYTDWSQVEPPYSDGESSIQALRINWKRFTSDNLLGAYRAELAVLREVTPDVPVTTNLMGAFDPLDYHRWAADLDVVSWDSYPRPHDPPATVAFRHALMRGLKGGQPFILMEQSPSQQNWQPYNWLKPPNVLRAQTFQAVAQGADGISYFQWRRSVAGIEKLHGAVVEHHGRSDARVFTEVGRIGAELGALGSATLGGRMDAKVAVLFDWPNKWALGASSGPSVDLDYVDQVTAVFTALWELGIGCEVLSPHDDLIEFDVIVAPVLSMVDDEVAASLTAAATRGATVIGTAFTALVDDEDMVHPGGAPGPLRELFGITVEEVDALPPDRSNAVVLGDRDIEAGVLCERLFVEDAQVVGRYQRDFYAGEPALTRNTVGAGAAFYVATLPSTAGWRELLTTVCAAHGIGSPLAGGAVPPPGVEVTRRIGPGGAVIYLINHNRDAAVEVTVPAPCVDLVSRAEVHAAITLAPLDVRILREQ